MTFDQWWATLETREQQRADKEFTREAFEVGAASRDAKIAELMAALEEATDFVNRHSEPWYLSGQALLLKCQQTLAKVKKP